MECCNYLIEHIHFKKKLKNFFKSLTWIEIEELQTAGFDRYLESVLKRGVFIVFERRLTAQRADKNLNGATNGKVFGYAPNNVAIYKTL